MTPVVKICGISTPEHALAAAHSGAGMIGMVFAPSRRRVSVEAAKAIRVALDTLDERPLLAGVFVNEAPETILATASEVGLNVAQLSGDESADEVGRLARDIPVIKALRFPAGTTMRAALVMCAEYAAVAPGRRVRLLVDAYRPGEYGGTGHVADWSLAAALAAEHDIILAGGLTPENVAGAIAAVAPWGVDVSSGVERDGVKDTGLIERFVLVARGSQPEQHLTYAHHEAARSRKDIRHGLHSRAGSARN
jgi:phosphoribosylanthranilate isomerase